MGGRTEDTWGYVDELAEENCLEWCVMCMLRGLWKRPLSLEGSYIIDNDAGVEAGLTGCCNCMIYTY